MQSKKLIFRISIVCVLATVLGVAFRNFSSDLHTYLQQSTYRSLNEIASEHKYYFICRLEGEWNILRTLAFSIANEESSQDDVLKLMNSIVEDTAFQRLSIVETDGSYISNDGNEDKISNFEFLQEIRSGKIAISEPMVSTQDGQEKKAICMAYPMIQKGEVVYAVMGHYELDKLSSVLLSTSLGGESYSTIINSQGEVVITDHHINRLSNSSNVFDFFEQVVFENGYTLNKMKNDVKELHEGLFAYNYGGEHRMAYYQPTGINDWAILSVTPSVVVSKSALSIVKIVQQLMITVLFVFVILILWIFGKTKTESLRFKAKSERDSMTGLLNKATMVSLIQQNIQNGIENHALFVLDIDDFKGINDKLGHLVGDEVIIRCATILREVFKSDDVIGRFGGDEFAVLMRNVQNRTDIQVKAAAVIDSFQGIEISKGYVVSCSIGIVFNKEISDYHELFKVADDALYEAKKKGKNQFVIQGDC